MCIELLFADFTTLDDLVRCESSMDVLYEELFNLEGETVWLLGSESGMTTGKFIGFSNAKCNDSGAQPLDVRRQSKHKNMKFDDDYIFIVEDYDNGVKFASKGDSGGLVYCELDGIVVPLGILTCEEVVQGDDTRYVCYQCTPLVTALRQFYKNCDGFEIILEPRVDSSGMFVIHMFSAVDTTSEAPENGFGNVTPDSVTSMMMM